LPLLKVALKAFLIGRTEVSVADYRVCVEQRLCNADGVTYRSEPLKRKCNFGAPHKDDHPVNCVTWFQADAFCSAASARLPTEAEWEAAARGTDGREYPWGNSADVGRMVGPTTLPHGTRPVWSMQEGASPFGALHMAGNVWEWVAGIDEWRWDGRDSLIRDEGTTSGLWGDSGPPRTIRGGSWMADPPSATARHGLFGYGSEDVGFRCARDVP